MQTFRNYMVLTFSILNTVKTLERVTSANALQITPRSNLINIIGKESFFKKEMYILRKTILYNIVKL